MSGKLIQGPWKKRPDFIDPATVKWRRGRPLLPETPKCVDCDRPFHRKGWVPTDLVCADCRIERAERAERARRDALPATLFEVDE